MDSTDHGLQVDLVVKFGGSAITNKTKLETLNEENLNKAAELIKECCQQKLTCIVVHGAGSFGHHQAKEYKVNSGWTQFEGDQNNIDHVKRGFSLTRKSVTKLNHHVVDCLLSKDIPAIGISACGEWETSNGAVKQYNLDSVKNLLKNGFVPILHGDCVLDRAKGCAILSGDTIIQKCTEAFKVDRVVFLTSVKGVFSSPPDFNKDGNPIRSVEISKSDKSTDNLLCGDAGKMMTDSLQMCPGVGIVMLNKGTDVTGGMALKVRTAADIVRNTEGMTKVFICMICSTYARNVCLFGMKEGTDSGEFGTEFVFVP